MALEFYKRRFRMPGKKMQYVLAFTALLLAMALVFCWMLIRHKMDEARNPTSSDDTSSATQSVVYTAEDDAHLLLIVDSGDEIQFFLTHTSPADSSIRVTAVPDDAMVKDELTLSALYRKHGAAYIVQQLAAKTTQPLRHYIAISKGNAEKWFARLGNDLTMTLGSDVVIASDNGTQTTLAAGEHVLTAPQATALLCQSSLSDELHADVIVSMLGQYLHSGRNLASDFSYLANMTQTSLRIGDFNSYRDRLTYLAEQNSNGHCTIIAQAFADTSHN